MLRTLGLIFMIWGVAACGTTTFAFVPATNANSNLYGHAATDYAIPPQAPKGTLRVASYGIEELTPSEAPDQHVGALHVRVFVSNNSDQTWTFDTREQQLALAGRATSPPAFASANPDAGSSPPIVSIAPHGTRIVDVFFPMPADMQTAGAVPAFEFAARIHTDLGLVSESTPFQRVEVSSDSAYAYDNSAPQYAYNPYGYGYDYWDSPFWYNPGYVGFYGGVLFPRAYWGHPVFARGRGWGRPGYYHGAYRGGGGFHGGGHGRR